MGTKFKLLILSYSWMECAEILTNRNWIEMTLTTGTFYLCLLRWYLCDNPCVCMCMCVCRWYQENASRSIAEEHLRNKDVGEFVIDPRLPEFTRRLLHLCQVSYKQAAEGAVRSSGFVCFGLHISLWEVKHCTSVGNELPPPFSSKHVVLWAEQFIFIYGIQVDRSCFETSQPKTSYH